jgi:signal transduction histidine kinase
MWRARPRRGALGLRGRIVGAVLVTTVATLAVAAVAVLGPLEQDLRNNALNTLKRDLAPHRLSGFKDVDPSLLLVLAGENGPPVRGTQDDCQKFFLFRCASWQNQTLSHLRVELAGKLGVAGSEISLLGYPDAEGNGHLLPAPQAPRGSNVPPSDVYRDPSVTKAFKTGRPVYALATINGAEYARAAVPVATGDPAQRYVLAVRKPIEDIAGAVAVVRKAFIYAALAGLALTLILGIPLAATLVRRLRRLRQAALQLAQQGPSVEVPVDRARDEVGDLARAFTIMRRRLEQQEEARRAFVATASHELRTPLTSLEGMLELLDEDLQETQPDLEDARALLERARAQSRRLGRLAADLLDLSRIDAEVELRSEPVELGELSRAVIAEFELGTAERGLTLQLDDPGTPIWARGDPGSIARILRILLENAVRVSPIGTEISVELRNGVNARLSVRDEGPGVPPEERELIFQRFKRGRDTAGLAGFGLGLAIGRELAERMSGGLVLEDHDSPGAQFTLTLPVASAPKVELLTVG